MWAIARKDGYVQQCVATTTLIGNALDVRLSDSEPLNGAAAIGSWFANCLRCGV